MSGDSAGYAARFFGGRKKKYFEKEVTDSASNHCPRLAGVVRRLLLCVAGKRFSACGLRFVTHKKGGVAR